jgi:hypothetical protein
VALRFRSVRAHESEVLAHVVDPGLHVLVAVAPVLACLQQAFQFCHGPIPECCVIDPADGRKEGVRHRCGQVGSLGLTVASPLGA